MTKSYPNIHAFQHIFWRCLWEDMNISQWKIGDRTFFSLEVHDRLLLLLDLKYFLLVFCRKSFYWPLASSWLIRRKVGNSGHPKITLPIYYIPFQVKLQGECWAPPPPVFGPCRVKSIRLTNDLFGRWYRCRHGNNCKSVNWRECMTTIFPYIKQGWNDL